MTKEELKLALIDLISQKQIKDFAILRHQNLVLYMTLSIEERRQILQ